MIDAARVREILGSYGADEGKWPAGERSAALAAVRGDAALRRERAAAAALDTMLGEWATRDLVSSSDAGAAAARVLAPPRHWLRWAAGGSIAAALGAMLLIAGPVGRTATGPAVVATAAITEEGAFQSVFTATPDEES